MPQVSVLLDTPAAMMKPLKKKEGIAHEEETSHRSDPL